MDTCTAETYGSFAWLALAALLLSLSALAFACLWLSARWQIFVARSAAEAGRTYLEMISTTPMCDQQRLMQDARDTFDRAILSGTPMRDDEFAWLAMASIAKEHRRIAMMGVNTISEKIGSM